MTKTASSVPFLSDTTSLDRTTALSPGKAPTPSASGVDQSAERNVSKAGSVPSSLSRMLAGESHSRRAPRLAGLDSLRALAVLMVVVYHFVPSALPGGFIGVDVFFVLSGFLITSLLVQEWSGSEAISLKEFWRRRARRILPALGVMLVVVLTVVGFIGGDILTGLPAQILGAVTFSSNWVYVATGATYESALTPALFNNLWSLAVEEQFYLLWPLLVVAGFVATKRLTQRRSRAVLVFGIGLLAAGSAVLMFALFTPGADPTRVYFGTDTHLFGLMIGAITAFVMVPHSEFGWPTRLPLLSRAAQSLPGAVVRLFHALVALGCVAFLVWAARAFDFSSAVPFQWGLVAVDAAAAVLIAVIVCNQGAARRIERKPLAWVGRRSYGLYLWHWPVLVVVASLASDRSAGHDANLLTLVVGLLLTFVCAGLSYRFVELPIMRVGLRESLRGFVRTAFGGLSAATAPRELLSDDPAAFSLTRMRAVGGVVVAVVVAGTVTAGVTSTFTRIPEKSSIEASIDEGSDLIAQSQVGAAEDSVPDDSQFSVLAGALAGEGSNQPVVDGEQGAQSAPVKPKGTKVTVIGDSVTLAAASPLIKSLKGVYVDAEVSRPLSDAPSIMKKLKKKGKLRDFVVVSLATNSTARQGQIDDILKIAGDRKVIFVTGHADRSWIKGTNKLLRKAAKDNANVEIADWNEAISEHDKELASDGIHPGPAGSKRYAKVIVEALKVANT